MHTESQANLHYERVLLSTAQAAAFLGYTPRMLEARRVRGGGPKYVRFSKRAVRYRAEDLEQWVLERLVIDDIGSEA